MIVVAGKARFSTVACESSGRAEGEIKKKQERRGMENGKRHGMREREKERKRETEGQKSKREENLLHVLCIYFSLKKKKKAT